MNTSFVTKFLVTVTVVFFITVIAFFIREGKLFQPPPGGSFWGKETFGIQKFASDQEFKEYLAESSSLGVGGFGIGGMLPRTMALGLPEPSFADGKFAESAAPDRISTTNVQVAGIDEPDIVKTDGKEIFVSSPSRFVYPAPVPLEERSSIEGEEIPDIGIPPFPRSFGGIRLVKAFPPADLKVDSTIEETGDLLLAGNMLVTFPANKIVGYDVSDPASPQKKWTITVESNTGIVTSRLKDGKIYLVTQTGVYVGTPCPIRPLSLGDEKIVIPCTEMYHPVRPIPTDSTFSVMVINPTSGAVERKTAFVGSTGQSTIYMSREAVYIAYSYQGDFIGYVVGFFRENRDLVPADVVNRLEKLQSYDLSDSAKMTELSVIMQEFFQGLEEDERMKLENEFSNRMQEYHKAHKRDLERSGIVKISAKDLSVDASGVVPGRLLNQFALDEYEGNLRVAVTVGSNSGWWGFGLGGIRDSANDVYVFDGDLKTIGSVKDLGLSERIYSVRFIRDKGYVVTFRQTDPFYVLDLTNPKSPQLKGELKIPGFSSYLDPLTKDRVLGVGQEGSQVKISLFDVRDPANPTEASKYMLDEYWTEVASTHHAFLHDEKHTVFFLPGGQGGYIFSYQDDKLSLIKAVSNIRARRALYLNDYLYVVGDDKIVVLNEKDWERVNEVELGE